MTTPKPIYGRHADLTATKKPTLRGELLGHVVAFDRTARTVTLQFSTMPVGKLEEFWGVLLSREDLK